MEPQWKHTSVLRVLLFAREMNVDGAQPFRLAFLKWECFHWEFQWPTLMETNTGDVGHKVKLEWWRGLQRGSSSGSWGIHIPFLDARQTSLLEKKETNPFSNVI